MSNASTQYPTQSHGQVDPNAPFQQGPAPKKKHTVRNLVIGSIALVAVIGGCSTALAGGSNTTEADMPAATSSSQAGKPAEKNVDPKTEAPESKPADPPKTAMTTSQEEAVEAAESYLSSGSFSKKGLYDQLTSAYGSDFSKADARFALKQVDVDYNAEAVEAAESYLSSGSFSKKGLFGQLTSDSGSQFTENQATFAVKHIDVDYNAEAVEAAESYLESGSFSRQGLLDQLTSDYGSQFTKAQAGQAVDEVGL